MSAERFPRIHYQSFARRFGGIGDVLARHSSMFTNVLALTAGTGSTAILGFVYWWFAARNFPAQSVGYAAAAISMMNFLAQLGELGMGTLLMGEVPKAPESAPPLIAATLFASLLSMLVVGFIYLVISDWTSIGVGEMTTKVSGQVVFSFGLALTGFTLVLDQAFVGMLRGSLQMLRTISFAAAKLFLLVVVSFKLGTNTELGIFNTWIGGQLCSLAVLVAVLRFGRQQIWYMPRVGVLKPLLSKVLRHHVLSMAIQAPALVLPFIVAIALSPQINAAFYAAWTLVNVVLLVPASLTAVIFSIGSREPAQLPSRLKISLVISATVGLVAGLGLFLSSEIILGLFSPNYPIIAGTSLKLLGFGTLGVMLKYHYVTVQRLRNRMMEAAIFVGAGGVLELLFAVGGAQENGLLGLCQGWLLAVVAEGIVFSPVIFRAATRGIKDLPYAANHQMKVGTNCEEIELIETKAVLQ